MENGDEGGGGWQGERRARCRIQVMPEYYYGVLVWQNSTSDLIRYDWHETSILVEIVVPLGFCNGQDCDK